jgi:hypothetical protein
MFNQRAPRRGDDMTTPHRPVEPSEWLPATRAELRRLTPAQINVLVDVHGTGWLDRIAEAERAAAVEARAQAVEAAAQADTPEAVEAPAPTGFGFDAGARIDHRPPTPLSMEDAVRAAKGDPHKLNRLLDGRRW